MKYFQRNSHGWDDWTCFRFLWPQIPNVHAMLTGIHLRFLNDCAFPFSGITSTKSIQAISENLSPDSGWPPIITRILQASVEPWPLLHFWGSLGASHICSCTVFSTLFSSPSSHWYLLSKNTLEEAPPCGWPLIGYRPNNTVVEMCLVCSGALPQPLQCWEGCSQSIQRHDTEHLTRTQPIRESRSPATMTGAGMVTDPSPVTQSSSL